MRWFKRKPPEVNPFSVAPKGFKLRKTPRPQRPGLTDYGRWLDFATWDREPPSPPPVGGRPKYGCITVYCCRVCRCHETDD